MLKWWKINFSRWKKLFLPIPRQLAIRTGSGWGTGFHVPSRLLVQKWRCLWPWEMKKNFLGLEKFIIPFNHFDVQSQAKATYWSLKSFFFFFKPPPTWTGTIRGYLVSFLNIHSSRLRHRFPCAFWANINLVELVPMRRNENPKHTHGCVLIEAPITHTFGPKEKMPLALGNEKKLSGPWKVYYSIQSLWRSEPSKGNLLKPKKCFLF